VEGEGEERERAEFALGRKVRNLLGGDELITLQPDRPATLAMKQRARKVKTRTGSSRQDCAILYQYTCAHAFTCIRGTRNNEERRRGSTGTILRFLQANAPPLRLLCSSNYVLDFQEITFPLL
jgi:hypothetical protein